MRVSFFRTIRIAAGLILFTATATSPAQTYPERASRIVVGAVAGGFTDILARLIAQPLVLSLGQPVLVDNRPGGGGTIATEFVARAAPDGYTLLLTSLPHVINPALYSPAPYDALGDFTAITLVVETPNVMLVHPGIPARTLQELVALVKAAPGRYNYASNSVGSSSHLGMEIFRSTVGLELNHVPYKGSAAVTPDLLEGRVSLTLDNLLFWLPQIKDGKLRALVVTGRKRSEVLPGVPTFAEAGFPNVDVGPWFGVVAPARLPRAIVDRLNRDINAGMRSPEVRQRLVGAEIIGTTPEAFAAHLRTELLKWGEAVKRSGAKPE